MSSSDKQPGDHHALPPEIYGAMLQSGNTAGNEPGWLVLLAHRQSPPGEKRMAALAKTFDVDGWTASQWIRSPAPRIMRRVATEEKAAKWVEYFRDLHLRAFAISEKNMVASDPVDTHLFTWDQWHLTFEHRAGFGHIALPDVLCIVAGEVREETIVDHTEKIGFMGELARGHERVHTRSRFLIDIHGRAEGEVYRLDQDELDLGAMYPDREQASSVMIREVLASIREVVPAVPFFGDFSLAQDALGNAHQLLDRSTGLVRRWLHGARGARISEARTTLVSGLPAFQLYSAFLAAECRELGTGDGKQD
ncbi:MAG: hypothetical protein JJU11_17960 [Candidatus Sumerlaeia bacterium]|nr:hypothetical protein [Candidatus Sumerlaeia bacterium]